jgi:Lon protease-like protein
MADTETFEALPRTLPIFPLPGVLLLPGGELPLNIFEPRYLAMTRDAMKGARLIGMVQPIQPRSRSAKPKTYRAGCVGRIAACVQTPDNRFRVTLAGIARFMIVEELPVATLYRQVLVSYGRFRDDLATGDVDTIDRGRMIRALRDFLHKSGITTEWPLIERLPGPALVNTLSMAIPFAPNEKQALLEAPNIAERARVLTALFEMAVRESESDRDQAKAH